jgi:hypothetical protein
MRTGRTGSDSLMLVLPVGVSFALFIIVTGGPDSFLSLLDMSLRQLVSTAVTWLQSL